MSKHMNPLTETSALYFMRAAECSHVHLHELRVYVCVSEKNVCVFCIPWTCSVAEASVLPTLFSVTHVYVPSSSSCTFSRRRVLSLRISNLSPPEEKEQITALSEAWAVWHTLARQSSFPKSLRYEVVDQTSILYACVYDKGHFYSHSITEESNRQGAL